MTEPFLGAVSYFGGNFAPRGYATCSGQLLSISQNTALFSILGTTYGGNGQTTFALPDLRGRVPVGSGSGPGLSPYVLGQQAGTETVTLNTTQLPAHNHAATFANNGSALNAATVKASVQSPAAGGAVLARATDTNGVALPQIYAPSGTATPAALGGLNVAGTVTVGNTGGNQPVPNLQPYLTLTAIIALQGIFPSRN